MTETICTVTGCDRPTHDGWYVCETCGRELGERLADLHWMLDELETVMSLQTRYGVPAGKVSTSDNHPLPLNVKASEQRSYLVNAVATACRLVIDEHPEWLADSFWQHRNEPREQSPALAGAWLEHRIAGLRLHPLGGEARNEIMRHWAACEWLIDRPPERRYLGECATDWEGNPCGGRIYQRGGRPEARCDTCGGEYEADRLREVLIKEARDRNVTAAEAATLSVYLGLSISRTRVRGLVNKWGERKVIETKDKASENGDPRYNFGTIIDRISDHLARNDTPATA